MTNRYFYINIISLYLLALVSCNNLINSRNSKKRFITNENLKDNDLINQILQDYKNNKQNNLLKINEEIATKINENPNLIVDLKLDKNKIIRNFLKLYRGRFSYKIDSIFLLSSLLIPMVSFFSVLILDFSLMKPDTAYLNYNYCKTLDPIKSFCSNESYISGLNTTCSIFYDCDTVIKTYKFDIPIGEIIRIIIYCLFGFLLTILTILPSFKKKLINLFFYLGFKFRLGNYKSSKK